MPSTIESLFAAADTVSHGLVSWRSRVPVPEKDQVGTGVYVVALSAELRECPIAAGAVANLLRLRPELTLDGIRPEPALLSNRLSSFWCPDEVVLYIGLAGPRRNIKASELSDRVAEYYKTTLGAGGPHAGGWPLKTLTVLDDLSVHYSYCDDVDARESRMLESFASSLSLATRHSLHDTTYVMPFANLQDGLQRHKNHGIKGARAPRLKGRTTPSSPSSGESRNQSVRSFGRKTSASTNLVNENIEAINQFLQNELRKRVLDGASAVEAARWLDDAGILKDSQSRPGKPLRELLRAGLILGQRQEFNRRWFMDTASTR